MSNPNNNDDILTDAIYPNVRHPYYIVAPPYIRTSAGARVMHLLCHSLNQRGETAYVLLYPAIPWARDQHVAPDLMTPILTPYVIQSHFQRGLTPIVVIPETISGDPFNSPCVVRYVLNFPGLLGGDKEFAPEELCFSYSKVLATTTRSPDNILFLPATDTRIFRPAPEGQKRQGSCFYADKYKKAHHAKLFDITKDSVEITRDERNSQTPLELAKLFHRSEVFYTYENTALATEAVLCGCPAVFLPNPHLSEIIAAKELGPEGYAWGTDLAEVARAKATVGEGARNYMKSCAAYWRDLENFMHLTQQHVRGKPYSSPVQIPSSAQTAGHLVHERGFFGFLKAVVRKLYKTIFANPVRDELRDRTAYDKYYQIPLITLGFHGGTRVLVDLANELALRGIRVRILLPRGRLKKKYDYSQGVEVKEIGLSFGDGNGRYVSQFIFLLICPFYLRKGTLVANFFPTLYSVKVASLLFGNPYIYFVQDIETWFNGISGFFLNNACRLTWQSRRMVTTSPSIAAELNRRGYHLYQQVRVGVSRVFFETPESNSDKSYDMICFPRREDFKRKDRLEKIAAMYRERFGNLKVLCVGQHDDVLNDCRSWADVFKPDDDAALVAAIDSARILLFTSEKEGLGLPPLEGMARGVPCIVFENEGVKTFLENGKEGFLVESAGEEAAVEYLNRLLRDQQLYQNMSLAARRKAEIYSTTQGFRKFLA